MCSPRELQLPCCTTGPQPRLTLRELMHESFYNSNKWKIEYQITANSPYLHSYMFFLLQNHKPGDMKILLGSWAKAFLWQVESIILVVLKLLVYY